jgi:hypothetical protein
MGELCNVKVVAMIPLEERVREHEKSGGHYDKENRSLFVELIIC